MATDQETRLDTLKEQLIPVLFHIGAVSLCQFACLAGVDLSLQVRDRVISPGSMST